MAYRRPWFPRRRGTTIRGTDAYPFPDCVGEWGHDHLEPEVPRQEAAGHPLVAAGQRLFPHTRYLRSRERLFADMRGNPPVAGGGSCLSASSTVEPDVPWDNIDAVFAPAGERGWRQQVPGEGLAPQVRSAPTRNVPP